MRSAEAQKYRGWHSGHSKTTRNTHGKTHWKTHSHTLTPTHLSGGFEIELGLGMNTPNNYLSLPRPVIHFTWIYSHLPLRAPSLPPSSSSSSSTSVTHSHLLRFPSITGDGNGPSGLQIKCGNTAIMPLTYGKSDACHITTSLRLLDLQVVHAVQ